MKLELSHSNIQEVFEAIELASEYGLRAEVMTSAIGIARENPEYDMEQVLIRLERFCLFCKYNFRLVVFLYAMCISITAAVLVTLSTSLVILFLVCSLFVFGVLAYFGEEYLSNRKVKILYKVRRPLNYGS